MIRTTESHLHISALTHAGLSGKNNEDRFYVGTFQLSQEDPRPSILGLVCDGIGGHRAGEVAAGLAAEYISRAIALSDGQDPLRTLWHAIDDASRAIAAHAASRADLQGMGSTCACAWVIGHQLFAAYVGDSRLYLIRGKQAQRLSRDHSWVQEAMEKGILTERQARDHPNSHVLRRHLGVEGDVEIDFRMFLTGRETDEEAHANQGLHMEAGDIILLCSDGLTDVVRDEEILGVVRANAELKQSAEDLVAMANQRGGPDNITLLLLAVPEWAASARKKNGVMAWLTGPS